MNWPLVIIAGLWLAFFAYCALAVASLPDTPIDSRAKLRTQSRGNDSNGLGFRFHGGGL